MSRANNQDIYSRFEAEYEDIVSIALSGGASFAKQAQSVPKFLQKYAILCVENPTTVSVDARFNILNNLRSLSIEILKNYPQQIDNEEGAVAQFFLNEVNRESEEITVDFNGMIKSLQDLKHIKDVTSIEDANGFYYYTILEHYILIANNLAYTCLEQENFSTALNLIIKTIDCWRLMQYNSYYLRYQISTVLINLASLVEEDYKVEASQLLCNSALHLENLEMEIDHDAESIQIYEFISDRASQFLFLLRSKDDKQSFAQQKFCYRKAFLLARLCMVYAYYADFLAHLGKKQEGDFARKHANILKKELEKKEEQSLSIINTPKKEEDKSVNKHHKSGTASHSSSRPTTALTALTATATTNFSHSSKVSKENIIFQKHLLIHGKKYRVIVVSVNDFDCLEIIAYDKPNNKLVKLFLHFQEVLDFARRNDLNTESDEEMAALFSKLTKKLYIKDNNLCLKDVTFFPRIEDLKISSLL